MVTNLIRIYLTDGASLVSDLLNKAGEKRDQAANINGLALGNTVDRLANGDISERNSVGGGLDSVLGTVDDVQSLVGRQSRHKGGGKGRHGHGGESGEESGLHCERSEVWDCKRVY